MTTYICTLYYPPRLSHCCLRSQSPDYHSGGHPRPLPQRPSIPAWPYGCCCVYCFAGVVRSNRRGELCAPWMWMMCVSMFLSVRLATCVSPGRLRVRLRVGILRFARPSARGVICDASGAKAGFSPGRYCAVLLCSILCWY